MLRNFKSTVLSRFVKGRNKWRPLSVKDHQIRLLTVEPSTNNEDVISCSLSIGSLDKQPEFAALSYTWGDPTVTVPILLHGEIWSVTTSLYEALQHLRHPTDRLVIFVDAICINQQDLIEKSTQVLLMSRVYSQANIVHCWLSPPVEGMDRVHQIFMQIGRGVLLNDMSPDLINDISIRALIDFLEKPYWKRAWIIQEVILPDKAVFHCGKYQFAREDLPQGGFLSASLASVPRNHPKLKGTSIKTDLVEARRLSIGGFLVATMLGREYISEQRLGVMILSLARQAASVQHDHIYAILAILPPELRAQIRPDYRDSIKNVYSNFAYEFMGYKGETASLLQAAVGMDENPLGLPGWTPDFTVEHDEAWEPCANHFMPNSQVPLNLAIADYSYLGILAHRLDEVVASQPLTKDDGTLIMMLDEPERSVPLHREWRQFLGLGDDHCGALEYVGGGDLEDAYWRTLCQEKIGLNAAESTWITQSEIDTMAQWYQRTRTHDPLKDIDEKTERCATAFSDELTSFRRRVGDWNKSSSYYIFKTKKGYIGMTDREHEPQAGDCLYLIAGTAAPTILRHAQTAPSGDPAYTMVSQAYISGLMLKTVLPRQITPEMPAIDYTKIFHPHIVVAGLSWERVWLK